MSRVTIGKLVDDFIDSSIEERDKAKDIEVVPRKIVEDIIEQCDEYQQSLAKKNEGYESEDTILHVQKNLAKIEALMFVMHLASGLLRDFEEGEEA